MCAPSRCDRRRLPRCCAASSWAAPHQAGPRRIKLGRDRIVTSRRSGTRSSSAASGARGTTLREIAATLEAFSAVLVILPYHTTMAGYTCACDRERY